MSGPGSILETAPRVRRARGIDIAPDRFRAGDGDALTRELLELRSGILCARLILNAALQNPESRGCHYRVD